MELKGSIKSIGQTESFGKSDFKKRELVLTTAEQYPQVILIEFVQDKCLILDKYKVGQEVTIGINIRGREWTNPQGETKYFNSLQGWKIDAANGGAIKPPFETVPDNELNKNEESGLPF